MHVTVNARSEDDVDERDIMNKVAKASGANYSVHKEKPKKIDPVTPVVHKLPTCFHLYICILI